MTAISVTTADDLRFAEERNLTGLAAKRSIDDTVVPTREFLRYPPGWIDEFLRLGDYNAWMSMSTVSVRMNNPKFSPHVIWCLLKEFRGVQFTDGVIHHVSSANDTTNENDINPPAVLPKPKKGRKSINPKQAPKRPHGCYKSFGRSVEVRMTLNLDTPFKGVMSRDYCVKFFSTNMQVPGCCSESHEDVVKITNFMLYILRCSYAMVPAPPPGFARMQQRLIECGERPLVYASPRDYEMIERGPIHIYSRNYTFHYRPLVENRNPNSEQTNNLHLRKLYEFLLNNPTQVQTWLNRVGLPNVTCEFTEISETANRRIQLLFYTPQYTPGQGDAVKKNQVTKAFIEGSGKLNIELMNCYYWHDPLWRILCFLNFLFLPDLIRPRMSTDFSLKNVQEVDKLYQKPLLASDILSFIADVHSDDDS